MSQPTPKRDERELERLEAISALERGPATPDVSAVAPTAESEKLIENPALGFNSCSLCGHGGTSGSILARIREYVTFYANSDADLSDDMAIGRQEVSKSVMEILNEAEPVPAPTDEDFTCGGACEFHGKLWCKTFDRPCREYVTAVELEREQHDHQDTREALEIVTDELNALKSRESAPVPAPRLEPYLDYCDEMDGLDGAIEYLTGEFGDTVTLVKRLTKLRDRLLSAPPVGTQPTKGN